MDTITDSSFARRTMLAGLRIETFTGSRKDRGATDMVHANYSSGGDSGRYVKSLFDKSAMKDIQQACNAIRAAHAERTLPWSQDGMRILPSANHGDYADTMRALVAQWQRAVDQFIADYPRHVANAQTRLNGMFNPADYPATDRIGAFFSVKFEVLPFPDANDFRVDLADADLETIKQNAAENIRAAEGAAMRNVWERLHGVVRNMADRLKETRQTKDGPKPAIFRDSLVDNIKDLCALLPGLNVAGDPALEQARQETVAKLAGLDPERLRNSTTARAAAAADAGDLANKLSAYTAQPAIGAGGATGQPGIDSQPNPNQGAIAL